MKAPSNALQRLAAEAENQKQSRIKALRKQLADEKARPAIAYGSELEFLIGQRVWLRVAAALGVVGQHRVVISPDPYKNTDAWRMRVSGPGNSYETYVSQDQVLKIFESEEVL